MPEPLLPPGFRFHPTDEELILYYLRNRATSVPCPVSIIAEVDIYKFDPWDLPAKAMFGDREWYFFSPRDRKYPNGIRPNRAAASGYWKATGTDKPIVTSSGGNAKIGVKKALVFYRGKPPRGVKTDWIMHEYRLAESAGTRNKYHIPIKNKDTSMRLDDWVLCRIYKKSNSQNSCTPAADAEREDSNPEDSYLLSAPEPTQQNHLLKIEKSSSLSEMFEDADYSLLSRFFCGEAPAPEVPAGQEHRHLGGSVYNIPAMKQSSFHQDSFHPPTGVPPAGGVKRQRAQAEVCHPEESGVLLHPSKKYYFNSEIVDMLQYNPVYQLNSHLGFR